MADVFVGIVDGFSDILPAENKTKKLEVKYIIISDSK